MKLKNKRGRFSVTKADAGKNSVVEESEPGTISS